MVMSDVSVTWVKGHATRVDIERGRTTEADKRGNDGADSLAVAGARMHRVSEEVVESAKKRKDVAMSVQRMMVAVLKARLHAEADVVAAGDRGSDPGDCFADLSDVADTSHHYFISDEGFDNGDAILSDAH